MSPGLVVEAAQRCDGLLDAALEVFDELGYGATPVPVIAQRAGVAVGSIYRYFPGKEQLVNALYQREKSRLSAALFDGLDVDAEAAVVFAGLWNRLCRFATEHPAGLCFLELHHHEAYLDATSRALAAEVDATVNRLLQRWQRQGVIRGGDPALLAAQLFCGFVGVIRHCRANHIAIDHRITTLTHEGAWRLLARP